MGLKEQNLADLCRTSKVVDRRGSKRVVTMSGKDYELIGKPVVLGELRAMYLYGFTRSFRWE